MKLMKLQLKRKHGWIKNMNYDNYPCKGGIIKTDKEILLLRGFGCRTNEKIKICVLEKGGIIFKLNYEFVEDMIYQGHWKIYHPVQRKKNTKIILNPSLNPPKVGNFYVGPNGDIFEVIAKGTSTYEDNNEEFIEDIIVIQIENELDEINVLKKEDWHSFKKLFGFNGDENTH